RRRTRAELLCGSHAGAAVVAARGVACRSTAPAHRSGRDRLRGTAVSGARIGGGVVIGYQRYCQIKQAAAAGRNASQIAAELGLHRETVAAWLGRERYERSRGAQRPRRSKLDA